MQVRTPRSRWTARPLGNEAGRVGAIVGAGLVLAVAGAVAAVAVVPERSMKARSAKVAMPVDFDVLERGADIADLERGRSYYMQLCFSCHGASGRGDGEWAYRMTPRPADLTGERTRRRSDRELRAAIDEGVVGTAMRGWKDRLSDPQIHQVLSYVRHLGLAEHARGAPL